MLPPRFPINAAQIDHVVALFYASVRRHEVLGPIFAAHVTDWPAHEAKIAGFWKKAILHEAGYDGNPMQVHMATGDVRGDHFAIWLALFDQTLDRALPGDTARGWSALAHRIGRGLRMGVEDLSRSTSAPPRLS
ncbi:group III truncated hemoglobin [Paracoccus sp. Z330]|uniref:Group III truncated hemoglobin n=1 Tax=Paracoccus onchidii TaxID=3017813 RepID=A0ABT4ZBF3_9RHOB|nr:group III truncated hemoglobin [Paracoccus onchidii]MDB6176477.1 group III truncated hemoglobin [Paracoccus onchidii]